MKLTCNLRGKITNKSLATLLDEHFRYVTP